MKVQLLVAGGVLGLGLTLFVTYRVISERRRQKRIRDAEQEVLQLSYAPSVQDMDGMQRPIFFTGHVTFEGQTHDPAFGIRVSSPLLVRQVEVF